MAIADRAGKQLEELVPEIAKTTQLLQEIVSASVEQNAGAGQINNAVQQLNTITQRNASHSEEMASGAEELATLAEKLKVAMGWFRLEGINTANKVSAPKQVKKFNVTPPSEQRKKKNFEMNLINENRSDAEFEKF
jgi:methyl-accepting chemotaxis protein